MLGMMVAPGPWMTRAEAGTLAQLQREASAAKVRSVLQPRIETCVGIARSPSCRAAFETALRGATPNASRGALYQALMSNRSVPAGAGVSAQAHQIAVKFYEDPEWQRRAKGFARDGLPFMRVPEGINHELLVGITARGTFGFALKDTTGQ
jgi:hypothetical protein